MGHEIERREALKCMAWAGTGALYALSGGIARSAILDGAGSGAAPSAGLTFLQLSDSHIGFDKAANPDARATYREAIAKVKALAVKPDFIIHTGDITQLSRDNEFDDADQILREAGIPAFFVPGEHDMVDEGGGKAFLTRHGKGSKGAGWFSFDHQGVHFVGLVNVADLKPGGMGNLGAAQLARSRPIWRAAARPRRSWCSRISRSGRSTNNGAGAPATRRPRWPCSSGSAR